VLAKPAAKPPTYVFVSAATQEENKGTPSVIMLQSAHNAATLIGSYAPALDEFPIIELPFTSDDNVYDPLGCVRVKACVRESASGCLTLHLSLCF